MEDLKKIQEFFSKPLNEVSGNIDLEDFAKVYQAIAQSGHPATVMLAPIFGKNEIEIIVGQDAPDPIIVGISNIMDDLGYKSGRDYSIAGDSSTLSRRQYSDIRRVNGGHKDYFEESVNEGAVEIMDAFNDVMDLVKKHSRNLSDDDSYAFGLKLKAWFEKNILDEAKKLTYNDFVRMVKDDMMAGSSPDERPSDKQVASRAKAYYNDYLQGASVDDLFLYEAKKDVKGDIADLLTGRYGWKFQLATGVGALIANLARHPEMIEKLLSMIGLNEIEEATVEVDDKTEFKLDLKHLLDKHVVEQGYSLTKEHETDPNLELKVGDYQTQHFHMCPGAKSLYQDIENKVEDMGLAIRSAKLQDALFAMEESALENGANEADVFAAETIADQIMAMASMMGLDKEHSYIQGHVEKIKGAVDKGQVAESSTSEERRIAKRAIRSIAKYRGVSEDEARNDLIRAAKELGSLEENMSLDDQAKAYYLAKVKTGEIDTLPEDPKAAFLAQMTKDQMSHDGETLRRERGLEETASYIAETIKLGMSLNEELCDKGKRYIKARQAAGEKSSAYLSGRAVRVCKGQIEWPKKGKKK